MRLSALRHWHKRLGLSALVVVLLLSITGILLNHTDGLKLNQVQIHQAWLNDWYGIDIPQVSQGISLNRQWFIQVGKSVYFNQTQLTEGELQGAWKTPFGFLLALKSRALLTTDQGEAIDWLNYPDNRTLQRLEFDKHTLYFRMNDGAVWQVNTDWTRLTPVASEPKSLNRVALTPVPDNVKKPLQNALYRQGLSLERLILDIHSGRFFGSYGHWVMDGFAIIFIIISLSGFWIYLKQFRNQAKRK